MRTKAFVFANIFISLLISLDFVRQALSFHVIFLAVTFRYTFHNKREIESCQGTSCFCKSEEEDILLSRRTITLFWGRTFLSEEKSISLQRLAETRSSWLNCALRGEKAVYWVSIGQQWLANKYKGGALVKQCDGEHLCERGGGEQFNLISFSS